jgi:primosomal protein N' (replication factor Y)
MPSPLTRVASVVLDDGLDRELDYSIPSPLSELAAIGKRVRVPVRTSFRSGTIMGIEEKHPSFSLRPIDEILSADPFIQPSLVQLGEWMADYYCCSLRKILRLFLPPSIRKGMAAKITQFVVPVHSLEELARLQASLQKKSPAQARLLQALINSPEGMPLSTLLLEAKTTHASYKALLEQKIVRAESLEMRRDPLEHAEFLPSQAKVLSAEQQEALAKITHTMDAGQFATHLVHGITGSGKTEVYLQAIEHALQMGKSTIFLVPEIALTSQTVERIRSRFRDKVALLHHRLSEGEKRDAWHAIHRGDIRIVLGPRSSIFAPVSGLGLIIIDEEHEGAYKQTDESPCYHARDVSIMRGKLSNATVILGSATPTLETYYNALEKKYILSRMVSRPANAHLPHMHIVDLCFLGS